VKLVQRVEDRQGSLHGNQVFACPQPGGRLVIAARSDQARMLSVYAEPEAKLRDTGGADLFVLLGRYGRYRQPSDEKSWTCPLAGCRCEGVHAEDWSLAQCDVSLASDLVVRWNFNGNCPLGESSELGRCLLFRNPS
jgi:hypothetical protein